MVSIHRILIVLYMTIRVLCFVFRFKRGVGVDWMPAPLLYRINIQKAMACPAGTTGFVSGYKSSTK